MPVPAAPPRAVHRWVAVMDAAFARIEDGDREKAIRQVLKQLGDFKRAEIEILENRFTLEQAVYGRRIDK